MYQDLQIGNRMIWVYYYFNRGNSQGNANMITMPIKPHQTATHACWLRVNEGRLKWRNGDSGSGFIVPTYAVRLVRCRFRQRSKVLTW